MAIYRVQIQFPHASGLPRDTVTINPHYFGDSPQALADALKTNLIANTHVTNIHPFVIKIYDAQKAPPSFPLATASNGTTPPASAAVSELSLCLSYYSTWNRPRYRGRLYLPSRLIRAGAPVDRPTSAEITNALSFGVTLGKSLPPSHNWVVYSKANDASYGVTNYWVDDEWDIVRSRGLRGTVRQQGTIP